MFWAGVGGSYFHRRLLHVPPVDVDLVLVLREQLLELGAEVLRGGDPAVEAVPLHNLRGCLLS